MKKLKDPIQRMVLVAVAAALVLTGALFVVPVVNSAVIGLFWFLFKVFCIIYLLIWFRGTFPRFRYDQLMNIGWKVAIPVGMAAVMVNAVLGMISGAGIRAASRDRRLRAATVSATSCD